MKLNQKSDRKIEISASFSKRLTDIQFLFTNGLSGFNKSFT